MGFRLISFFAAGNTDFTKSAINKWPQITWKRITDPFKGFGAALPELHALGSQEEFEKLIEAADSISEELPDFSRSFPDLTFVFVDADCSGGTCAYNGYACKNGRILNKESGYNKKGDNALKNLAAKLGANLKDGHYFKPFSRGFFTKGSEGGLK